MSDAQRNRGRRKGTLALSWGSYGGFYMHRRRICLGRLALTYVPHFEIDDMMEATAAFPDVAMERDMAQAYIDVLCPALVDAIESTVGPIGHAPFPIYSPQIEVARVKRWNAALRDGTPPEPERANAAFEAACIAAEEADRG